jgi:cell wall-associated NlpC family hydrolase
MNRRDRRSSRPVMLVGAAGVLAAFAAAAPALAADWTQPAAMPAVGASPVAGAVADAEAQAQAKAQAAAEAAAAAAQAAAARQSRLDAVVDLAYAQVGDAYVYGAAGPDAFDCSGFTMWVYQQALGVSLPHNTHAQFNAVDSWYAGEREPQPGDLVFFFNGADHVGIYVGDGMMVHAANPGAGVTVDPVNSGYWANHLTGYGRVVH